MRLVSSEYRDELSAAEERLARLDAVHEERELRQRRVALERERETLRSGRRATNTWSLIPYLTGLIAIYALKFALMYPNSAGMGSLVLFIGASCITLWAAVRLRWKRRQRQREFTRIDAELRDLEMPRVRV